MCSDAMEIKLMYNDCYGAFSLSQEAIREYNHRKADAAPALDEEEEGYEIDRADLLMIQICSEMGAKADGKYAKIKIKSIPSRYANYYSIKEYDGFENVTINYDRYKLDRLRSILTNDSLSSDDKVAQALNMFEEDKIMISSPVATMSGISSSSS